MISGQITHPLEKLLKQSFIRVIDGWFLLSSFFILSLFFFIYSFPIVHPFIVHNNKIALLTYLYVSLFCASCCNCSCLLVFCVTGIRVHVVYLLADDGCVQVQTRRVAEPHHDHTLLLLHLPRSEGIRGKFRLKLTHWKSERSPSLGLSYLILLILHYIYHHCR